MGAGQEQRVELLASLPLTQVADMAEVAYRTGGAEAAAEFDEGRHAAAAVVAAMLEKWTDIMAVGGMVKLMGETEDGQPSISGSGVLLLAGPQRLETDAELRARVLAHLQQDVPRGGHHPACFTCQRKLVPMYATLDWVWSLPRASKLPPFNTWVTLLRGRTMQAQTLQVAQDRFASVLRVGAHVY